jgi:hypothetical protein
MGHCRDDAETKLSTPNHFREPPLQSIPAFCLSTSLNSVNLLVFFKKNYGMSLTLIYMITHHMNIYIHSIPIKIFKRLDRFDLEIHEVDQKVYWC